MRPLAVIVAYWAEVIFIEEEAVILEPLYFCMFDNHQKGD